MIQSTTAPGIRQDRRLRAKTQDRRLVNLAVDGAGISAWEAEVLVDVVKEVYFREAEDCPLRSGQMRYECVAATEGAGKPLAQCRLQTVVLTLIDPEDRQVGPGDACRLRRRRIMRLSEEAREQGGLLSQEDLAQLLMCDVRTIRRDIGALRRQSDIYVATRGQQHDIGPGVSHKGVAVRLWLEGREPLEVARRINHTLKAVERYLQHFSRVVFLLRKKFHPLQIALTVGISTANVQTYLEIYNIHHREKAYWRRFEEIELIGAGHWEAVDEKKGGPSRARSSNNKWRRP